MADGAVEPMGEVMPGGGLVDLFLVGNGACLTDPGVVGSVLDAYDEARARPGVGGTRNITETVVTMYATDNQVADNA